MAAVRQILIMFDPRRCRCHPCFPNSVSLGSSAIVKVTEQVRTAQVWEPGSQEGVSFSKRNPSKGSQVPRNRFPSKGSQEEVPKQGSQEEVPKQGLPGRGFARIS